MSSIPIHLDPVHAPDPSNTPEPREAPDPAETAPPADTLTQTHPTAPTSAPDPTDATALHPTLKHTLALGGAAVLGLGGIGIVVGASPMFVAAIVAALVAGAVHTLALTVPGLVVVQILLRLKATPEATLQALVGGMRDGAALLLAALPLVLFFGASLGQPIHVVALSSLAGEAAIVVTLAKATRTLIAGEPNARLGATTYTLWALIALATGTIGAWNALWAVGGAL